jgi:hypothetical protein
MSAAHLNLTRSSIGQNMAPLRELDVVRLTNDIAAEGLVSGELGTILMVFKGGEAYLVEFSDDQGRTRAMPTLKPTEIEFVERCR